MSARAKSVTEPCSHGDKSTEIARGFEDQVAITATGTSSLRGQKVDSWLELDIFVLGLETSLCLEIDSIQWGARFANSKLMPRKYCRHTVQGQTAWLSTQATSGYSTNASRPLQRENCRNQHTNNHRTCHRPLKAYSRRQRVHQEDCWGEFVTITHSLLGLLMLTEDLNWEIALDCRLRNSIGQLCSIVSTVFILLGRELSKIRWSHVECITFHRFWRAYFSSPIFCHPEQTW